jgi:hypothetical protein
MLLIYRTRGNHRARVNASYGPYDYDDDISDVTYGADLKSKRTVPAYVANFELHARGTKYDAWTQTNRDEEVLRSYVAEIKRLRKVIDAMGDEGLKLKDRVRGLSVAQGEIGNVLQHLNLARKAFDGVVKYARDNSVDLPREGGGDVVEDGAWFRVGPDEDAPMAHRLPKRLAAIQTEARHGAPADTDFVNVDDVLDAPWTQNTQDSWFNLTPATQTGVFADDVDTIQDVIEHQEASFSKSA